MRNPAEPEPKLSDVPMYTHDEIEIKVNSILFRPYWRGPDKYDRKKATATIEALRVFYINNVTRTFRTRTVTGCEEIFKVGNGCIGNIYGKFSEARGQVEAWASDNLDASKKKFADSERLHAEAIAAFKTATNIKASNVKVPVAVE